MTNKQSSSSASPADAVGPARGVGMRVHDSRYLVDVSATEARELIDAGHLDADTYLQALHDRAQQVSHYNALTTLLPLTLDASRNLGALAGIPVVVKDSIDVQGAATTAGTPGLVDNVAHENAPLVQRLVDAGAMITGKAVMHELSLGCTSNNALHGAPKNPWDPTRISGGSSGGSASAVALGIAPLSIGADTGGSVRVPAALCGIVGSDPPWVDIPPAVRSHCHPPVTLPARWLAAWTTFFCSTPSWLAGPRSVRPTQGKP
jgi:Asp-tRNA(Asn)/Glu-tRNA(Gln) amidotransferase A subunit family amidase